MPPQSKGAPASPSGSRASHEAPAGLHPTGFDPSRLRDCANACEGATAEFTPVWLRSTFEELHGGSDELADGLLRRRMYNPFYRLLSVGAFVEAAKMLMPPQTLWAVGSMEDGPFARLCWPMPDGTYSGGHVEGQAETAALSLCAAILRGHAIAMEARKGGDGETRLHPKDDSAGRKASPKTHRGRDHDTPE